MQKRCSKCGIEFGCKNEAPGCWCESVSIPMDTLQYLKKNFDNCLCPVCLTSFEEQEKPANVVAKPFMG